MFKKRIISLLLAFSLSSFAAFAADKININTASADELQLLNGVGPSTANAIVEYREQNGAFANVEDLANIKGIGEKKVANIAENVTVSD
ncbi:MULTISPECIES: ComEA family DNA-binding protein [unclassified Methylophaga]|jgi:competence protein ComEA|uniref:ComEA family DNA-binding protein n=1 Tax=unclassified Methylophaga TaxID=2629249 RepID=UPI000C42EE89|nr:MULTISPECIES: ComEA family DNA-binding protein [unclassified Methylophaga]MAL49829.1 competence protein ComEA [Methylophaga sp.]MBP24086.1 competence protein ComEA [Methylophaga sp.]HCC80499.1 competence protein ComEA [Methylophaga sp.]|tara:strand:+ start:7732 stop:7998 length:267 start_codon:yes stop_codon:yes gene_type:complete